MVSSARQAAAKKPAAGRKSTSASRGAAESPPATKSSPRKRAVSVVEDPEAPAAKRTAKAAAAKVAAVAPAEAAPADATADPEALEPDAAELVEEEDDEEVVVPEEDTSGPFIRDLARALAQGGDRVTVLVPHTPDFAPHRCREGMDAPPKENVLGDEENAWVQADLPGRALTFGRQPANFRPTPEIAEGRWY